MIIADLTHTTIHSRDKIRPLILSTTDHVEFRRWVVIYTWQDSFGHRLQRVKNNYYLHITEIFFQLFWRLKYMGSVFCLDLLYVATNIDLITASSFSLLFVLLPSNAGLKSALLDCTYYSLQVVTTLLCLLCATSVRSMSSPLPGAASLVVTEQTLSSSSVTDLADTGTESVDRSELVVPEDDDDDMEVAAILIFRPYYTYWENRVQRRRKQTG